MHILLTDLLTCPRCGPDFGLILLADEILERRVTGGSFGCPNCRDRFPVVDGVGDLRPPPRVLLDSEVPETMAIASAREDVDGSGALEIQALLGLAEGPGHLLLIGGAARYAQGLSRRIDGMEIVVAALEASGSGGGAGVSRMVVGPSLPFRGATMRGVVFGDGAALDLLDEAARVTAPGARVVVLDQTDRALPRLEALGLSIVLAQEGVVVAAPALPIA